jgi:hypothetical protein
MMVIKDNLDLEVTLKTLSIIIPDDLMSALQFVGKEEKIGPSTAMRKLVRIGYESYLLPAKPKPLPTMLILSIALFVYLRRC